MKLERPTNRSKGGKSREMLQTEQPAKSEIFDPRIDVPAGDFDRIKQWVNRHPGTVEQTHLLVVTAWIGWIDPEHRQAVQRTHGVRECGLVSFVHRRNGGRLQKETMSDDPTQAAQWKLTERASAYVDFGYLVEAFPEVRAELQKREFASDFQELLQRSVHSFVDGSYGSAFYLIQDLKALVQAWPGRRTEVVQALAEGGQDRQKWFVERIEAEDSIVNAVAAAANLVVVFPELRSLVEGKVKKRMKEIHAKLQQMHTRLGKVDQSDFYPYQLFIKNLTILGGESAVLDAHGDLQVKLRPLALGGNKQPLPTRAEM